MISLNQSQSNEQKVARQEGREDMAEREITQGVGPSGIECQQQQQAQQSRSFTWHIQKLWKGTHLFFHFCVTAPFTHHKQSRQDVPAVSCSSPFLFSCPCPVSSQ